MSFCYGLKHWEYLPLPFNLAFDGTYDNLRNLGVEQELFQSFLSYFIFVYAHMSLCMYLVCTQSFACYSMYMESEHNV